MTWEDYKDAFPAGKNIRESGTPIVAVPGITYYLVGGYVRDKLLGVRSKDVDFAVEAPSYEAMLSDVIVNRGAYVWQERPEFGSIRANDPRFGPADYTLCRRDGTYSDGRRPDSVEPGTILEDLARRDFTVNAIAQTMGGEYLDPHGGRRDLDRMLLRTVGDPRDRFREDALRLLRAVRFHIVRGFELDPSVKACLRDPDVLSHLPNVSVERVYDELGKCYRRDTYATLKFFREYRRLEDAVFSDGRLHLAPGTGGRP